MELLQAAADHCIRRALGLLGIGIAMVMLLLSFDLPLALRAGADLLALAWAGMLIFAWRAPRLDVRHSLLWRRLQSMASSLAGRLHPRQVQRLLSDVLRSRLIWHAKPIGATAAVLWMLALAVESLDW
jgi:hypothetical protein